MRLSLTKLSGALIAGAAALALAGAASADTAKRAPQARAKLQAKTDCPTGPGGLKSQPGPPNKPGLRGRVALNPQPEPPSKQGVKKPQNPGALKGFNPQPEPPGRRGVKKPTDPLRAKGFNPQPEPPAHPPNPC